MSRSAESIIKLFVEPANINLLNRIMEGYSHLGALTTTDSKSGKVYIRCTPDTLPEVELIVANLPFLVHKAGGL